MKREILSAWEKQLNRNINAIKRAIKDLNKMKLQVEIAKDVETMLGGTVDHVYVMDYMGDRVILQKHLFTVG